MTMIVERFQPIGVSGRKMLNLRLADVILTLNANLLRGDIDTVVHGVCADSRLAMPGDLFFALVAQRDGHEFVADALRHGAVAAVVSKDVGVGISLIQVPDTLYALGSFAKWHRLQMGKPIVGVTGSVGKTTTKEMIAAVLGRKYTVLKNEGNYNNEIGVPLTLLQMDERHDIGVLEMAMRGMGEIKRLANIALPRIAVITNIGLSHIERLGSREAIASAKAEILDDLPPDGLAILPADDEFLPLLRERRFGRVVTFGESESADVRAENVRVHTDGCAGATVKTPRGGIELELAALGRHNIPNALAAVAVGLELGVDIEEIKASLEVFNPPSMRFNIIKSPLGYTVIDDVYNANPASMEAALRGLAAMQGRKIAVLGDMLELGEHAERAHLEIGELAAEQGIDRLVTVGEASRWIAEGATRRGLTEISSFEKSSNVAEALKPELRPGDIILVKGSRGMTMEVIVEGLLSE